MGRSHWKPGNLLQMFLRWPLGRGEALILATIEFQRLSRSMVAHLTNDGWQIREFTALADTLNQLFEAPRKGSFDNGSIHRVALEAAATLNGRVVFVHKLAWRQKAPATTSPAVVPGRPRSTRPNFAKR